MAKRLNIQKLKSVSNADFWNLARAASPTFASHTSKGTAETFSEKGFQAITRQGLGTLNEFFELSIRIAFQKIDVPRARNPLAGSGLVEVYDTPNGGFVQRIATENIKPISPGYKGLDDYDSPDPFIVRKPRASERFFQQNFDYQSLISIQDFQVKQIFISEYGMGAYLAGILAGLENGYIIQEYENTLEALHAALNSSVYPLKDTQEFTLDSWGSGDGGAVTDTDLKGLILALKKIKEQMSSVSTTSAYNAGGFSTVVDPDDYVLLVRTGIMPAMDVETLAGAFHEDRLLAPWRVQAVDDFGGLTPYIMRTVESVETKVNLQPVYERLGVVVGYTDADSTVNGPARKKAGGGWEADVTTAGGTDTTVTLLGDSDILWDDPNADRLAIIAQKGVIFENRQNSYQVNTIYNPRGMYNNYWANSPNNSIVYDHFYNLISINKPSA